MSNRVFWSLLFLAWMTVLVFLGAWLGDALGYWAVIVAFPVRVTGPSGGRSYRVTDTDLTAPQAELIAAMRYCVDTPTGLARLDEVHATAGTGEQVTEYTPRPVVPIVSA